MRDLEELSGKSACGDGIILVDMSQLGCYPRVADAEFVESLRATMSSPSLQIFNMVSLFNRTRNLRTVSNFIYLARVYADFRL